MRWSVLLLVAACGSGTSPTVVASGPPGAMIAQPAPDDLIVAQVAGRPVFGSCVAAQIRAVPSKSPRVALDECIAFELMAQEAERRGILTAGETIDATRTALVTRLVDQFAARTSPEALKSRIDGLYKPAMFARAERRESWHALAGAEKTDGEAKHIAAKALASKVYEALKDERGLSPAHFKDLVRRIEPDAEKLPIDSYKPTSFDDPRTSAEYKGALFAIPEVGRVAMVKSEYGYHVILFSEDHPAVALDREAAGAVIHANLQKKLFEELLGQIATSGITARSYPERLEGTP